MAQVQIVMGSPNDLEFIKAAGVGTILDAAGITYGVTVCSAHRNLPELETFAKQALADGTLVFIGVAGMAAALPGALAGLTGMVVPIVAVPLDGHGVDSCIYMPPGVPVLTAGVGKPGLKNATLAAAQIIAVGDAKVASALKAHIASSTKKPQYDLSLTEAAS